MTAHDSKRLQEAEDALRSIEYATQRYAHREDSSDGWEKVDTAILKYWKLGEVKPWERGDIVALSKHSEAAFWSITKIVEGGTVAHLASIHSNQKKIVPVDKLMKPKRR